MMILRLMVLVTLIGLIPTDVTRAEEPQALKPNWKKGDTFVYELVRSRERKRATVGVQKQSSRTEVTLEVLDRSDDGYTLRWSLGKTVSDDPRAAGNPLAQKLQNISDGFKINLKIDADGHIQEVTNWKELQAKSKEIVEAVSEELVKAGVAEAVVTQIKAQVAPLFATKEKVEAYCTREPQIFFMPLGRDYVEGKPIEFEDSLPLPIGGAMIPTAASIVLKSTDSADSTAVVVWEQATDQKKTREAVEAAMKELAKNLGKEPPQADAFKSMTMKDEAVFTIDTKAGWPLSMKHTRSVTIGEDYQTDTISMQRKNAEK